MKFKISISILVLMASCQFVDASSKVMAQTERSDLVVISSVEDTLQVSQVISLVGKLIRRPANYIGGSDSIIGMQFVLALLAKKGAEIHYVSSIPPSASFMAQKFLESSSFPPGPLHTRPFRFRHSNIAALSFKQESIRRIIEQCPSKQIIFIGNNGAEDGRAFAEASRDPQVRVRLAGVFIHRMYETPIAKPVGTDQKQFLTAAHLAIHLWKTGAFTDDDVWLIAKLVNQALSSGQKNLRSRVMPNSRAAEVSEVRDLFEGEVLQLSERSRKALKELAESLAQRLPYACEGYLQLFTDLLGNHLKPTRTRE